MNNGFFEIDLRLQDLERNGDPLVQLSKIVPWERFRYVLEKAREKERRSNAGRRPLDAVMMFKILVLQSLYNLSDDAAEYQISDRLSFMRFLGLSVGERVPDAKTIWIFREQLTEAGLVEELFSIFDNYLRQNGFSARSGQIVDASIVSSPRQRNTREENEALKETGEAPEEWDEPKRRQKDVDARWTQKNGVNYYGYKNHVCIDARHKFIRGYAVTNAAVHDSQVFEELLDEDNSSRDVWADSAYRSEESLAMLAGRRFREHLQRKGRRGKPLTDWEKQGNRTRSKIRSRIEHVFGVQAQRAGNLILRTIGIYRARAKIGLRNLAFNLDRYVLLTRAAG